MGTLMLGCQEGGSVGDCGSCTIFYEDGVEPDTFSVDDPSCTLCVICPSGEIAWNCANLLNASDSCALRDCNGVCSSQLPLPNPWYCGFLTDGTPYCDQFSFPFASFDTLMFGCQENGTVDDCESCTILYEDGVDPDTFSLDDPRCADCTICSNGDIAYNCTNLDANIISGSCVVQDCNGVCSDGT
jgi:hypothetical protein